MCSLVLYACVVRSGICPDAVHVWLEMLANGISAVASILRVHVSGHAISRQQPLRVAALPSVFSQRCTSWPWFGGSARVRSLVLPRLQRPSRFLCDVACCGCVFAATAYPALLSPVWCHTSILYIAIHSRWHIPTRLCPWTVGVARTEGRGPALACRCTL